MNNKEFLSAYYRRWQQYGAKIAIQHKDKVISYAQLSQEVNEIAQKLPEADHYIVKMEKSIDYIITIFSCFQKGVPFTPCSPELPQQRIDFIANQVEGSVVVLDDLPKILNNQSNAVFKENDQAYVIYTSGSTGTPKGVKVLFAGIDNIINEQIHYFSLDECSRFMWLLSQNFDASFSDILTTLKSGATLVIPPCKTNDMLHRRQFEQIFNQWSITHSDIPPSLLKWLQPDKFKTLEHIVVGGELCDKTMLGRFHEAHIQPIVVYGPTETTICSSLTRYDESYIDKSIGTPVNKTEFKVLDYQSDKVLEEGEGELLIGGVGVCAGYVDKCLDDDKFISINNQRFFKTGDRVIKKSNQTIFEGRVDRQFKHAGQLICPEEIEAALLKIEEISIASVYYLGGKIRAVIEKSSTITESEIKKELTQKLPLYMVPSSITDEQKVEKNPNDKIDHKHIASNAIEKTIMSAFQTILEKDTIDKQQTFSEQGGDSLAFMELVMELEDAGIEVDVEAIAEKASVSEIAKQVQQNAQSTYLPKQLIQWLPPKHEIHPVIQKTNTQKTADKTVLMTGANGFLGVHLLEVLQKESSISKIICLMRGKSFNQCWEKLVSKAGQQQVHLDTSLIEVIWGDMTTINLGVSDEQYDKIAMEVDEIVHCGAEVNNIKSFDALFTSNVAPLINLIKLTQVGSIKTLHNMSSLSVWVSSHNVPSTITETQQLNQKNASLYTGYAQTKWLGEYLVQYFIKKGGDAVNYRLGLLTPSLRYPYFEKSSFAFQVLQDLKMHNTAPVESAHCCFDVTPVDLAAQTICDRIVAGDRATYHITSDQTIAVSDIIKAVSGEWVKWEQVLARSTLNRFLYECHGKWPEFNIFEATRVKGFNPSTPVIMDKQLYLETYLSHII